MLSEGVADARPRLIRDFFRRNVTWFLAALPFVLAGLRVMVYSGGDSVVLKTLVATLDIPTVLLGTMLPIFPVLVALGIQLFAFNHKFLAHLLAKRWVIFAAFGILMIYSLFASFPGGLWTPLTIFGGLTLGLVARRVRVAWRKAHPKPEIMAASARPLPASNPAVSFLVGTSPTVIAACTVLSVLLVTPQGMWLPLEQISTGSSSKSLVAYVLKETPNWTTTISSDKSIRVLRSSEITGRLICNQGDFQSIVTMLVGSNPSPRIKCKT